MVMVAKVFSGAITQFITICAIFYFVCAHKIVFICLHRAGCCGYQMFHMKHLLLNGKNL